ncbi:phospho-2-dehydro-3-deoxyheptonate aldolase 2, chloroplastic-like [Juglans microcarpa x Juglans regia]|uniref:phospho-2-dehydro-3-deoxyheptonate aldolase 2, chloroplastic-like n=1 Tax=Juglans microcarpa x Juglans regia TaxID=2249226 RepID=UPI001B7DBAF3|nr:phospho-2-dehydro-3-deoxyheptonate aldolase 2, chloroplastic-like [Juglans microcarpa x Juglans regia]
MFETRFCRGKNCFFHPLVPLNLTVSLNLTVFSSRSLRSSLPHPPFSPQSLFSLNPPPRTAHRQRPQQATATSPRRPPPPFHPHHQPTYSLVPTSAKAYDTKPLITRISAVHAAEPLTKQSTLPVAASNLKWTVETWKSKTALQLPEYPDQKELDSVLQTIEAFPPIVFAGEARHLEEKLAEAAVGNAFLLQGRDCAKSFKEFSANNIRDTFRVLLQMGAVLMFGGQMPIIRVGRMAGQFAKPRSAPFEERDGVKLPSYKGDNINGDAFNEKSRIPDPQRLIRAYCQSAATLNLLRAFATGGYAAMQRISEWNLDFAEHSEQGDRYAFLNLSWFHFSTLNVSLSSFNFWYLTIFNEPGSLRENLKHSLERVYPKNRRKDIIVLVHSLVFCEYHAY